MKKILIAFCLCLGSALALGAWPLSKTDKSDVFVWYIFSWLETEQRLLDHCEARGIDFRFWRAHEAKLLPFLDCIKTPLSQVGELIDTEITQPSKMRARRLRPDAREVIESTLKQVDRDYTFGELAALVKTLYLIE